MILAIPYWGMKYIVFFGLVVPLWKIGLWAGHFFALLIVLIETKRLKLSKAATGLIFFLALVLNDFFEVFLFYLSRSYLHGDWVTRYSHVVPWNNLGRVYFGSLIGTFLAVVLGALLAKQWDKLGQYLDVMFFANITGLIFYRIGAIPGHYQIGKVTNFPLGMEYFGEVRHETSLYQAFFTFLLFLAIWFLRKKLIFPGALALVIVGSMSIMRFFLDFFRSNDLSNSNYFLTESLSLNQIVYLTLFVVCGFVFFYLFNRNREKFFADKPKINQ